MGLREIANYNIEFQGVDGLYVNCSFGGDFMLYLHWQVYWSTLTSLTNYFKMKSHLC